MSFKLESVVPWGRNLNEYRAMFMLTDEDMKKRIASFGDGPARFNCQATKSGCNVTSFDPIYCYTEEQLRKRIDEVRDTVIKQTAENMNNFVWDKIADINELEFIRMSAMKLFLREVRIFPICNLDGKYSPLTDRIIEYFSKQNRAQIIETEYEFQKGAKYLLKFGE